MNSQCLRENALIKGFILLITIIGLAPLWLPEYPPQVDLAQHAANLQLLVDLLNGTSAWSDYVRIQLATPYYGFYLPAAFFAFATDAAIAARLTSAIALVSIPIALSTVLKRRRLPAITSLLVVPSLYGFSYQWGFASFLAAIAIFIVALDGLERYFSTPHEPTLQQHTKVLGYASALFLVHAHVFVLFMVLYGCRWLAKPKDWQRALPALPITTLAALWFVGISGASTQAASITLWELGTHRLINLFPDILGFENGILVNVVVCIVIAIPFFFGFRLSRDRWRALPFLLILLGYFVLPNRLLGGFFTYQRLTALILPFFILALERGDAPLPNRRKLFALLCLMVAAATVVVQAKRAHGFAKESAGLSEIAERLQRPQRILSLIFDRDSSFHKAPAYLHFGQWLGIKSHSLVEFNFASFWGMPVVYRDLSLKNAPDGIEWSPNLFYCNSQINESFDAILVRAEIDLTNMYFDKPECAFSLALKNNGWWLYTKLNR